MTCKIHAKKGKKHHLLQTQGVNAQSLEQHCVFNQNAKENCTVERFLVLSVVVDLTQQRTQSNFHPPSKGSPSIHNKT